MIGLIASIRIDPAAVDQFETAFATMAGAVRTHETGTLVFTLFRGDQAGAYHIVETYRDQAALDVHRATPHFGAFRPTLSAILLSPPETEWFDVVV